MSELKDRREHWFYIYKEYLERLIKRFEKEGINFTCPCCGYPTLHSRGGYEICHLCDWEDDGQDETNADKVLGGPNTDYSLTEARDNFKQYLTMYRPHDEKRYQRGVAKLLLKRQILSLYNQLLRKDSFDLGQIRELMRKL